MNKLEEGGRKMSPSKSEFKVLIVLIPLGIKRGEIIGAIEKKKI